jgi:hypothetical protein
MMNGCQAHLFSLLKGKNFEDRKKVGVKPQDETITKVSSFSADNIFSQKTGVRFALIVKPKFSGYRAEISQGIIL